MGYKRKSKQFHLKFVDPEFDGLDVLTRSMGLGKFLEMEKIAKRLKDKQAQGDEINWMFDEFSKTLINWNLEDDDDLPVPATFEGLKTQDIDFVKSIIDAWMKAMVAIPAPLPESSNDGETFPESSLPMETLSPNRTS